MVPTSSGLQVPWVPARGRGSPDVQVPAEVPAARVAPSRAGVPLAGQCRSLRGTLACRARSGWPHAAHRVAVLPGDAGWCPAERAARGSACSWRSERKPCSHRTGPGRNQTGRNRTFHLPAALTVSDNVLLPCVLVAMEIAPGELTGIPGHQNTGLRVSQEISASWRLSDTFSNCVSG